MEEPKVKPHDAHSPRLIIVGDVHGCLIELKELLLKVGFENGKDRLIFVGDLVGKVRNLLIEK